MRIILCLLASVTLTACSTTQSTTTASGKQSSWAEWLMPSTCPGTRPEDPQVCRGQGWQQIPNQPFEAQIRRARGETW